MNATGTLVLLRSFLILLSAAAVAGWPVGLDAAPTGPGSPSALTGVRRVTTPSPEALDQPPAPAALLRARATGLRGVYARGAFVSVQVNVDASGNNIIGDAANEPSIAVDPTNRNNIAIAWRQFDSISSNFRQAGHAFSTDGGQSWTFPGVLEPGQFRSDPVLGFNAAGAFYWSSLSSGTSAEVFKSLDGGATWLAAVGAFGGDKQWLAVDDRPSGIGAGHIYQNWNVQFSCCPPNDFTRSINDAASFQSPIAIPQPSMKWGTLDVGIDGTLYLAGSTLGQDRHLVARSSDAKNPAVTPTYDFVNAVELGGLTGGFGGATDPNPAGLLGQVWLAADPSNVNRVYIVASVTPPAGNPTDVMFVRSVNRGMNWSAPIRVNDDGASGAFHWFGTMSVAPNGRIDVVWNDSRNSGIGNISELYYSFSVDTGLTWSPNIALGPAWDSHVGWPQQNKIGDYYHMISDNGGADLAYATTFNGEQDVYFLRISADCDGNGIPDDQDVANGAPDCNDNLIPDTCEPNADCNGNSTQDICDIFTGVEVDCNSNLVPDSCETPTDCDNNGRTDFCDIAAGAPDCNANGKLDSCDISSGLSPDTNGDQIPDECEGACCQCAGPCSLTTPDVCTAQSGSFFGIGSSCDTVVCGAPNDDCVNRIPLPRNPIVSAGFQSECATTDGPSTISCGGSDLPIGADVWYEYVAPCTGTVRASLCGTTNYDAILSVHGGTATCDCQQASSAPLACGDDTCGIGGGPAVVTFSATAGNCYLIRVAGWNSSAGTGILQITYDSITSCECQVATPPAADVILNASGATVPSAKSRFLSFSGGDPGQAQAARVTFVTLPGAFGVFDGTTAWVGLPQPVSELPGEGLNDSIGANPSFMAAQLRATPVFADWSTFGVVHVYDERIIPSRGIAGPTFDPAIYEVQLVNQSCDPNAETSFSPALTITNARWGDLAQLAGGEFRAPDGTVAVDDTLALLAKFSGSGGAPIKARAELLGVGVSGPAAAIDGKITVSDLLAVLNAFAGGSYPFGPPAP